MAKRPEYSLVRAVILKVEMDCVNYRIAGNFQMVQIFVFFKCTFRMRKFEHAKIYITRGLRTRASDHAKF